MTDLTTVLQITELVAFPIVSAVAISTTDSWKNWRAYCHTRKAFLSYVDDRLTTLADPTTWRMSRMATARRNHGEEYVCWRDCHALSRTTGQVFKFFVDEHERIWQLDELREAGVSV